VHSSDPGACSVGQIEFNSTGPTFKGCATANIWSTLGSGGSGGGGGVTTGSNGVAVSGTNATLYDLTKIYIREDFACKAQAISGVASASCNQGFYNLTNINGSGALTVQASTANMVGAWRISSGATSGNDSTLNHLDWGSPFFPHPSATPYTFETRFALGTDTNDYQALGITESVSTSLSGNITKRAMWCDVTDTASQGTWQCYTCDGTATTTVTLSPTQTADLNPHVIGIQYTNTLVMFFFDGTQVGTSSTRIEAGGNGLVTPIWETKTSTTSAASMIVDAWRFFQ
jgi:hypothetical protein